MRQWRQNCIQLNPGWKFRLYDDDENRRLVEDAAPWFTPTFDAYPLGINRIDAVRFMYLYAHGGIYLDLDYTCVRPFSSYAPLGDAPLGDESPQMLIGEDASERTGLEAAGNSWLAAAKGHPLALAALCRLRKSAVVGGVAASGAMDRVDHVGGVAGVWFVRGLLKAAATVAVSAAGAAAIAGHDVANVYPNASQSVGSARLSAAVAQRLGAWGVALVPSARVCPFGWRHRNTGVTAWATCTHVDRPANHSTCLTMFPQAISVSFHTFTWRPAGLSRLHCWSGHGRLQLADCLSADDGRPTIPGIPRYVVNRTKQRMSRNTSI